MGRFACLCVMAWAILAGGAAGAATEAALPKLPLNTALVPPFNGVFAYSNNHGSERMVDLPTGRLVPTPAALFKPRDEHFFCLQAGGVCDGPHFGPTNVLADGHVTGEQWQCVEYVTRYYWLRYAWDLNRNTQGRNSATEYWATANERGLISHPNGNPEDPPQVDDIVVFEKDARTAHVAIVREVERDATNAITGIRVIQQNFFLSHADANARLGYANGTLQTFEDGKSAYKVVGWLRLPEARMARTYSSVRTVGAGATAAISITTDGTLGTLSGANILDWRITVSDGNGSTTLLGPQSGYNSKVGHGGFGITATASALQFDFSVPQTYLVFQKGALGSSQAFYCLDSGGCGGRGESLLTTERRAGTVQATPQRGIVTFATVPESPAAGAVRPEGK